MLAALALRPDWSFERASAVAGRCRELLRPRVDLVTPPVRSTLVAFRPDEEPPPSSPGSTTPGVLVRELPGRGLVRVSCGWWTSDEDLDRLVAALDG